MRFVHRNQEIWFTKIYFILDFHHFEIQVMKNTISSIDENYGETPFSSLPWKNLHFKIPEFWHIT